MGDSPVYHLPWPEAAEVADVPKDMEDLARATDTELGKKVDITSPDYQRPIKILTALPGTGTEGDIVFLVP